MIEIACPSCGNSLDASDRFCFRCGAQVPQSNSTSSPSVTPPAGPESTPPYAVSVAPGPEAEGVRPGRSRNLVIVGAAVAAILVAGTIWYFMRGNSDIKVSISVPGRTTVSPRAKLEIQAVVNGGDKKDVLWSIQEGASGGSIERGGAVMQQGRMYLAATYTAPAQPGTYHIIATSTEDHSQQAVAQITVQKSTKPSPGH